MIIVANWKMNPRTVLLARGLLKDIKPLLKGRSKDEVIIAPPAIFLVDAQKVLGGSVSYAAQTISPDALGPHTGEISASMYVSMGVAYTILGHSERRARGETDADISKAVQVALKEKLSPIICVGEVERDTHGKYFSLIESQIRSAFTGVPASKLSSVLVAYEPIWAISTASEHPRPATPEDAHEMMLFITKVLTDLYGRTHAKKVRILYGGSVDKKNIKALKEGSGMQGFLVGGASVRVDDFREIIRTVYAR